jgi:hypothetical protein
MSCAATSDKRNSLVLSNKIVAVSVSGGVAQDLATFLLVSSSNQFRLSARRHSCNVAAGQRVL